jgi:hypothetical protein
VRNASIVGYIGNVEIEMNSSCHRLISTGRA